MGIWLKRFFALGYLPENVVADAFSYLIKNFDFSEHTLDQWSSTGESRPIFGSQ